MRTLVFTWIFLLMEFAHATSEKTVLLFVQLNGHYSTQYTEITKENSEWICKTELTPYYVSPVQPFSASILKQIRLLPQQSVPPEYCRDKISITDRTQKKVREYFGCADEFPFSLLIRELDKNCGRN